MRFHCLDWWSLILLLCFILLGLACRVGAMGSLYISPLSDMSLATSDCLEPYFSGGIFLLSCVCFMGSFDFYGLFYFSSVSL